MTGTYRGSQVRASWRVAFDRSALEDEEVGDEVQSGREGEGRLGFHEEGHR